MNINFLQYEFTPVGITLSLLAGAVVANHIIARALRRHNANRPSEVLLSKLVASRNVLALLVVTALFMIWVRELAGFVLSIAAIAGAMLIVSKELIMCWLGTMVRTISRPFQIGDVVEIGAWRGKVIDADMLTTTLLEMGPAHQFTGYHSHIPNSVFLSMGVKNLSVTGHYFLNFLTVPVDAHGDVEALRLLLLDSALPVVKPFQVEAAEHLQRIANFHVIDLPSCEPKALIEPVDSKQVNLVLRFACPAQQRVSVEQQILVRYYAASRAARETVIHTKE
jgi:small-conductance mechanosensitive channel